MRRAFDLAWLALLVLLGATWTWMPEQVGAPGKALPREAYMALMLTLGVFSPWLATRGVVMLARLAPGSLSLPHKAYWLAPERSEQTWERLS